MLTYDVIVGHRENGAVAIPISIHFHFESSAEEDMIDRLIEGTYSNYVTVGSGKKAKDGYYHFTKHVYRLIYKVLYESVFAIRPQIGCKPVPGRTSIVVDSKFCKLLEKYEKMLRETTYQNPIDARGREYFTRIEDDLIVGKSYSRNVCNLSADRSYIESIKNGTNDAARFDPFHGITFIVPTYEDGFIEEFVSMLAICIGEPVIKTFKEEFYSVIESLGKLYTFGTRSSRYIRTADGMTSAKTLPIYRDAIEYRERYIRCRG